MLKTRTRELLSGFRQDLPSVAWPTLLQTPLPTRLEAINVGRFVFSAEGKKLSSAAAAAC